MYQALYPKERYPQGHPDLANSLNNLGTCSRQGAYGEARGYLRAALAMDQALYPKERYPQGHPDLAESLNNLGCLLAAQGPLRRGQALPPARRGHAAGPGRRSCWPPPPRPRR